MSFTKHFALYISQYAFHIMNFTVCISQFAFHSMHFTVCISQYKFHIMHFTVCISQCAILVYSWTILVNFSAKKVYFNFFRFCPIVKSVISLYKLNTRGAGPISFHQFWNFWTSLCWYRHSICHYELPSSSFFNGISPAYPPPTSPDTL